MVPVWLLVVVLLAGLLVGAGLGWVLRQRTLAAGAERTPRTPPWTEPPRAPGEVTREMAREEPEMLGGMATPVLVQPPVEPVPAVAAEVTPELEPEPSPLEAPVAEGPAPPETETSSQPPPAQGDLGLETQPPASEATTPDAGDPAERLDARMDDVLSELERRYQGRRVGQGEEGEGGPAPRRKRRPRS